MPRPELSHGLADTQAALLGARARVAFSELARANFLSVDPATLKGANVLIRTTDQLHAALALVALDGIAGRMVIAPPDLSDEHVPGVIARARLDTQVSDGASWPGLRPVSVSHHAQSPSAAPRQAGLDTEWVLFTSGTTGAPKMVAHTLSALTGAISPGHPPLHGEAVGGGGARSSACDAKGEVGGQANRTPSAVRRAGRIGGEDIVWGTFYDIRRYGGLQILLRALLGRASLILSDAGEPVGDFLARLGTHRVSHLTGTPSHWRRALMSPALAQIAPRYLRLSGEIADQAVLDTLKARFPQARLGHAYASTEAGVGFEVTDGLEGFPASLLAPGGLVEMPGGLVEMKVVDGVLHVRSPRAAAKYVGSSQSLADDGFVDTGDMVEQRAGRWYFAGRRGGIINVGGLKIHPEEVEAVINRHPAVRLSRVSGRRNPVTGAIVVADVVLAGAESNGADEARLKHEILDACRAGLSAFKVPAMLRFVPALELTAAGKLARNV